MYDFEKYSRVSRSGSSRFSQRKNGNELDPRMSTSLPRLRKMPSGPGIFLPDADEILALELEIEVAREAVREHVVGRLVAFEARRRWPSESRPTPRTPAAECRAAPRR